MPSAEINIVYSDSRGLFNDGVIIEKMISEIYPRPPKVRHFNGWDSRLNQRRSAIGLLLSKYVLRRRQVTFHLEDIFPQLSRFSDVNVLFPNQEWLRQRTLNEIDDKTLIWCKTKYAKARLEHLNQNVSFVGFWSKDLLEPNVSPDYSKFLHLAGKSEQKGTLTLLELWKKHPDWPSITVVYRSQKELVESYAAPNITIINEFVSEQRLRNLMNTHGIHLCPSESEGFGHNIGEALSIGAYVVTTNAPPMNELVKPDYGSLVESKYSGDRDLSEMFKVIPSALEHIIESLIVRPPTAEAKEGSRKAFMKLKQQFKRNLEKKLNELL
jgi:glycosyltransferase involved in cell wall biosynthesis